MKKRILALALVAILAVGCGSKSDEGKGSDTEQKINRLSKEDYLKQISEKAAEMQELQATIQNDPENAIKKVNVIIDDMIALDGPKDLVTKEERIDKALADFKDLIGTAQDIASKPEKLTEYMTKLQEIATELNAAEADYMK